MLLGSKKSLPLLLRTGHPGLYIVSDLRQVGSSRQHRELEQHVGSGTRDMIHEIRTRREMKFTVSMHTSQQT